MKANVKYPVKAVIMQHYKYIILVLFVLYSLSVNFSRNMDRIRRRSLAQDYDGYWHLLRAQEIHNTGNWDNEINHRGNAPFGEHIHWTHAMDIVLLGGAYVGSLFTDFDSSLYWFGVGVGPLFYVFSVVAILFFGRVILGAKHGVYLALLFIVNPLQANVVYAPARPDHHCLINFLFIMYYFSFILLLKRPEAIVLALLTGILGALGLWSGLEILVLLGLSVFYLELLWIVYGDEYLRTNFVLTLALFICIAISMLVDEEPRNYWVISYDKRSIVHVTLFGLIMLYWLVIILLANFEVGKQIVSRFIIAIGGGVFLLLVCLSLFPEIIGGPMARVDPRLHALYLDLTSEFGTDLAFIVYSLLLIGPGLIYLVRAVHRKVAQEEWVVFFWVILAICVYSTMTFVMNRWVITLGITSLLANAMIIIAMLKWKNTVRNMVLSLLIVCFLVIVPLAPFLINPGLKNSVKRSGEYDSKLIGMLSFLESQDHVAAHEIVLANISIGPAIMYRTSFDVVGTANHNNAEGIIDTHRILSTRDDASAHELIEVRGIDYLLVDEELKTFARTIIDQPERSEDPSVKGMFIDRLSNRQIPDWLIKVPLPEGLVDTFQLYRVVSKNIDD